MKKCAENELSSDICKSLDIVMILLLYWRLFPSDGGKPDFFQNPGSGSNPGFNLKNPGVPVPK